MLELEKLIKSERMFDEWNPTVIMCSPNLEEALNVKALHVTEIRFVYGKGKRKNLDEQC